MSVAASVFAMVMSGVFVKTVNMVSAFVSRGFLGPELTGIWSLVAIATGYFTNINTGVQLGSEREIPYWRGKGDGNMERVVRSQMFSVAIIEGAVLSFGLMVYLMIDRHYRPQLYLGLGFVCAYILLWRLIGCYIIAFRTNRDFIFLSKSEAGFALVDLALIGGLVWKFGLLGQCVAHGTGLFARIAFWTWWVKRKRPFEIGWSLEWKTIRPVVAIGFPLMLGGFLWQFMVSADGLVVAKMLGVASLGYYSLGMAIARAVGDVPTTLSSVVFPKMVEKFGAAEDIRQLRDDVSRYQTALACLIIPAVLSMVFFAVPPLVRLVLPKFLPALDTVKILMFEALFIPMVHIPSQIFYIQKRMWFVLIFNGAVGLAIAAASLSAARWGMTAVAWATVGCYALFSFGMIVSAFRQMSDLRDAFKTGALYLGCAVYSIIAFLSVDRLLSSIEVAGFWHEVLVQVGGLVAACAALTPLFWKAEKDIHITRILRQWIVRRLPGTEARP